MVTITCDNIDRLVTTEMRKPGLPRGITPELYRIARDAAGDEPLSHAAATALTDALDGGAPVVLSTGFRHAEHVPYGETDGPPGAVALARALRACFGSPIYLVVEPELREAVVATARAVGLGVEVGATDLDPVTDAGVLGFTTDRDRAPDAAATLLDAVDPGAVVTAEKIGPNAEGVYHSALGSDISAEQAKVDVLVDAAAERDVLTVGIGDVGNEIGFGTIAETARELVPGGADCGCPCGCGIVTATATDVLVPAAVSNWGCHAVAAGLALVHGEPGLLGRPREEERAIDAHLRAGGIDGGTGKPTFGVDGVDVEVHRNVVRILREMVAVGLSEVDRGF